MQCARPKLRPSRVGEVAEPEDILVVARENDIFQKKVSEERGQGVRRTP